MKLPLMILQRLCNHFATCLTDVRKLKMNKMKRFLWLYVVFKIKMNRNLIDVAPLCVGTALNRLLIVRHQCYGTRNASTGHLRHVIREPEAEIVQHKPLQPSQKWPLTPIIPLSTCPPPLAPRPPSLLGNLLCKYGLLTADGAPFSRRSWKCNYRLQTSPLLSLEGATLLSVPSATSEGGERLGGRY